MASSFKLLISSQLLLLLLLLNQQPSAGCFTSIYSFGDATSDVGNLFISNNSIRSGRFPYGKSFFRPPTGRFSDGRLVTDFIAKAYNLPYLPPYLEGPIDGRDFKKGVDFAVAGATALDNSYYRSKGYVVDWTDNSLSVQVAWFTELLPSLCTDCESFLSTSLIIMGQLGVSDYSHGFFQGATTEEIRADIPSVIEEIAAAVNDVIALGAKTVMIPGSYPIGCFPAYLTRYPSSNPDDYDGRTGCLEWPSEIAWYHDALLKQKINQLREMNPSARIVYADYFQAAFDLYLYPERYGFKKKPVVACCGSGGQYNYNVNAECGDSGASACGDPWRYVSWDGLYLTEAANNAIAVSLLGGEHTSPPLSQICSSQFNKH